MSDDHDRYVDIGTSLDKSLKRKQAHTQAPVLTYANSVTYVFRIFLKFIYKMFLNYDAGREKTARLNPKGI